ncbi:hypothetical protein NHX12_022165 [Muraenolepis orangiensis]|uniref:SH2 domain-containing protein n=1 Tax=Muraenolepis orangiensis TaxID=630683 RepID=A0A9Q0EN52_9TELE|nr:hypothetical protein NHX12_022165 [Muraenolepis orangiensis]
MNLPSKEECESWNPEQVAHFMCQKQMPECAETVNILKIDGHRLLSLSHSDISKFSLIQQPQLQKIVQDINKNEGSLLSKLRRLKVKPVPKVPERDYAGEYFEETERWSDESDEYEAPQEDCYEPPPPHRVFTPSSSSPFSRDDYVDSCRNRSDRLPRKPPVQTKATKPLPLEPQQMASDDEEDYIDPEGGNQDDYIEPTEKPPAIVYEVPLPEKNMPPVSRFGPHLSTQHTTTQSLPLKVSPRLTRTPVMPEPSTDTEYEVCDRDNNISRWTEKDPPLVQKPLAREKPPKPVIRTKPVFKYKEHQSHSLPMMSSDKAAPQARPMIPLPQTSNSHRQPKSSWKVENGLQDIDKESDIHRQPWYASTCGRKTAEEVLTQFNKDGAFLVRKSSGQNTQQPYTLVVLYNGKVYNIPVRFIQATQQYALGREKNGEEHFTSVSRIIDNHLKNPLVLIDSQSNIRDTTKLQHAVRP